MRRKTFDSLMTTAGMMLTIVLLVAGGLLTWGANFASDSVKDNLAPQKIFFPAKGSPGFDAKDYPELQKYAGQQVLNGEQAQAYAKGYIGRHLEHVANGKTYSEVSAEAQKNKEDATLKGQVDTLFKGTTLQSMLLNAYAFGKFGEIAQTSATVMFILAAVMLVLSVLGFVHLRKVSPEAEV